MAGLAACQSSREVTVMLPVCLVHWTRRPVTCHTHTHTLILTWQIQQDRPRQHNMLTCGTSCHLTGCTALWCKRSSCVLRALCSTCFPFLFFFLVSAHRLLPAAPRLPKNIQDAAAVLHPGLFYLKRKVKCDKQRACANFYWRNDSVQQPELPYWHSPTLNLNYSAGELF